MRAELDWHPNLWLLNAVHRCDSARIFVVRGRDRDGANGSNDSSSRTIIAAAAAITYGTHGFVGNVMVRSEARRSGLGRSVMQAALDWLRDRGTAVVELDATPEGRPLYERLGFAGTQTDWVIHSPVGDRERFKLKQLSAQVALREVEADCVTEIAHLDGQTFGGDRIELLRRVLCGGGSRLYTARDASEALVGFLMARPLEGEESAVRLGPWVATSPAVAASLLLHAVGAAEADGWMARGSTPAIIACVAHPNQDALGLARRCGLRVVQDDLRMRLHLARDESSNSATLASTAVPGRPNWVYAMTAPMVG
jgi:GNAT superfamily N-acetyltransferase